MSRPPTAAAPAPRTAGPLESPRLGTGPVSRGRLTLRLADALGFCHGVRRAVHLALEARRAVPDRRVALAGPLVHNPHVHNALASLGIDDLAAGGAPRPDDVLILPAFGLPPATLDRFRASGARLVDTTCGSVRAVWRSAGRLERDGFTLVYHGKPEHEEALATLARFGGPWCVVRNGKDAAFLASRIRELNALRSPLRTPRATLHGPPSTPFPLPASPGFDPARHLERIGLAHQTTMRAAESLSIAEILRVAASRRWGPEALPNRFRGFETLCLETQRRQDAVAALGGSGVDRFVVVGGRRSNNAHSLLAAASRWAPAYLVEGPEDLLGPSALRHWNGREAGSEKPSLARPWIPRGPVAVGVTAGASTPDAVTAAVLERLVELEAWSS